ncbi:MAG: DUF5615 family PIN-like protein [Truepera sp.]|nr:DUF5615 family PIN-like protein [Truepera sp.]
MKFLTDEHIPPALVRGLLRERPDLDITEVRKTELVGKPDPLILERAAAEGRILITRDVSTMPDYAYARVKAGLPMPGVFIWQRKASIGEVLESLLLLTAASQEEEWDQQVIYIPLD